MARALILVADGFGIGAAPDSDQFGDAGSNTYAHIAEAYESANGHKLSLPSLNAIGLNAACQIASGQMPNIDEPPISGAYAAAAEISNGKDTPSGHWEMTGVPVTFDWGYYPNVPDCFPAEFLDSLIEKTGVPGVLGCKHASGTDILKELGEEHVRTRMPICYTSADSVFQVAAHEEAFGLDRLYEFCETARSMLYEANIGRVIARPFLGDDAMNFARTGNRRDYSISPPARTLLDKLVDGGTTVSGIGKISDIFAHQGISRSTKATGLEALIDETVNQLQEESDNTLIFTNLVNFDQDFGHRRDPLGYADALQYFDRRLPEIQQAMRSDDLLLITSDHGCDPTWQGTDHTREFVPLLVWQEGIGSVNLGKRDTFADLGQTLTEWFRIPALDYGQSFLADLH